MKSNYKLLGSYIQEVDIRNKDLKDLDLLGISIQKEFIPSIANTIGTDMSKYKIVKKNQFAYGTVTSRNGDKISIALLQNKEEALISQSYISFEIIDENKLLPEYLMMWFRRPEFDRYARYMSYGSAREVFSWEEMCNVRLPIPSIEKQREIVKEYNSILNRININEEIIKKLQDLSQSIYKEWFIEYNIPRLKDNLELVYNSELDKNIPKNWDVVSLLSLSSKIASGSTPKGGKENYQSSGIALIRSLNIYDFTFSMNDLAFINDEQAKKLKNVELEKDDILLNITGVSVARCCKLPDKILPARVNQHVMVIRPKKEYQLTFYLLCFLCHQETKSKLLGISQSGSTREALTKGDIENISILLPNSEVLCEFQSKMKPVFTQIENKVIENYYLNDLKEILLKKLSL